MQRPSPSRTPAHGVTWIETLVVLALIAISVTLATPSLTSFMDQQRLKNAAIRLNTDLQWARTEAVRRNTLVRWSWYPQPQGSCYLLHTGTAGDCQCAHADTAHCTPSQALLRAVQWSAADRVALSANIGSMAFDPAHGTVTPTGRIRLSNQGGQQAIDSVVNVMGRLRTCAPYAPVTGQPSC